MDSLEVLLLLLIIDFKLILQVLEEFSLIGFIFILKPPELCHEVVLLIFKLLLVSLLSLLESAIKEILLLLESSLVLISHALGVSILLFSEGSNHLIMITSEFCD